MIIDNILKYANRFRNRSYASYGLNEDSHNPIDLLRMNGIKIKNVIPHKEYIEVSIFDDVLLINFHKILKNFYFAIDGKGNKIFIRYEEKNDYDS